MRVCFARATADVAVQLHLLAVANEVWRKKRMRVHLVVVAVKHVEAVLLRHTGRVPAAASPLAKAARRVATVLEHRGDRRFAGPQRRPAAVRTNRGVSRVLARHQVAAQRRADRRPGQRRREPYSLRRKAVDVGCLDVRISHVRQLVICKLVGHDIDNVRLLCRQRRDHRGPQNRC